MLYEVKGFPVIRHSINKPLDLGHVRDEAGMIVRRELVGLQFDLRFIREAGIIADLRDAGLADGRLSQWEWQRFEFHDNGGLVRRYSFNDIQIIDRFRDGRGAVRQEMMYGRFTSGSLVRDKLPTEVSCTRCVRWTGTLSGSSRCSVTLL